SLRPDRDKISLLVLTAYLIDFGKFDRLKMATNESSNLPAALLWQALLDAIRQAVREEIQTLEPHDSGHEDRLLDAIGVDVNHHDTPDEFWCALAAAEAAKREEEEKRRNTIEVEALPDPDPKNLRGFYLGDRMNLSQLLSS